MFDKVDAPYRYLLQALVFPMFFQEAMMLWVWGAHDPLAVALLKRIFLLLPASAIILSCWISIACLLTVIIRQNRRQYVSTLFITWWDLGRAIFSFWAGFFKFIFVLVGWLLALVRLIILGVWLSIQDIVFSPLRAVQGISDIAVKPGTPWIAVIMTICWCALEAFVFTFVMTNLVVDTLGSVTGLELNVIAVQIILYFMLLAFVLGSYAIVASLEEAVRSRSVKMIVLVLLVEGVSLIFEVLFLYREFVDALVPWFAQYAGEDFQLGVLPTLMIAGTVWAGIRGMTWFLFAAHGTPTIMAIIQRTGLSKGSGSTVSFKREDHFLFIKEAIHRIQKDVDWCHERGDDLVSAFILPPLQIVGAVINFATMLISAKHLFQLPFKSYKELLHAEHLISRVREG